MRPTVAKKIKLKIANPLFRVLQFNGSKVEREGIGRLKIFPAPSMRKTLPDRSVDACFSRLEAVIFLVYEVRPNSSY